MESKLKIEEAVRGARGRRMHLDACPHCGGNVRRVRDIYGVYRQCIQCSREILAEDLPTVRQASGATVAEPAAEELKVA